MSIGEAPSLSNRNRRGENRSVESLRGQLLLASPALVDPNFRRSAVILGEHGELGALGVILNRPSEARVADAVPGLAGLVAEDDVVYVGGPVRPSTVLVLAEVDDPDAVDGYVVGDVGFLRGDFDADVLAASVKRARVFAGYAGWSPEQLEAELAGSDWMVEEARAEDVFAPLDADLWRDAVRRKGGAFRLVSTMPADPMLN
jgi:putative transcriptional regulator